MLNKDPEKRISADKALKHKAFRTMLSVSPLIKQKFVNSIEIINVHKIFHDKEQEDIVVDKDIKKMPNRIEDLSPIHVSKESLEADEYSNYLKFLTDDPKK